MYSECLKVGLKNYIRQTEIEMIKKALVQGRTVSEAARLLKLNRTTLVMKLRALKIKKTWLGEVGEE